ncbi:hypothetical protein [Nonlabens tegetincola]|nr:hypothetical protein [Nonlabens tegetincola]
MPLIIIIFLIVCMQYAFAKAEYQPKSLISISIQEYMFMSFT